MTPKAKEFLQTIFTEIQNEELRASSAGVEEAWETFFRDPFDENTVASHMDILMKSLGHPIPGTREDYLERVATNATGARMEFATKLFASSIAGNHLPNFKRGSLARMALSLGNDQGALDSAKADRLSATTKRDNRGVTLFVEAMLMEKPHIMKALTEKRSGSPMIDPYVLDLMGNTVLINYLRYANPIKVEILDELAAALMRSKNLEKQDALSLTRFYEAPNNQGRSAVHALVDRLSNSDNAELEQQILEAFAWLASRSEINVPDAKDRIAIMEVCRQGNIKALKLLYSLGGDISWISQSGMTALSRAIYYNKPDIIQELFALDSDAVMRSIEGMTSRQGEPIAIPMIAAKYSSWEALSAYLDHCIEGLDFTSSRNDNKTTLMYAVSANEPDIVRKLIHKGCDVSKFDDEGMTALHYAAEQFDNKDSPATQIFYDLINVGASVKTMDSQGRTPLDIVLNNGKFTSSSDFFYAINASQMAGWWFNGNIETAKTYLSEMNYGAIACTSIVNQTSPTFVGASEWMERYNERERDSHVEDVKQGIQNAFSMAITAVSTGFFLATSLKNNDYQVLTDIFSQIPNDWQLPAVITTSISTGLIAGSMFGTNLTQIAMVGTSMKYFSDRIRDNCLKPIARKLISAKESEKGVIAKAYKICAALRDGIDRIHKACKAFIKELTKPKDAPATPTELLGQFDDRTIVGISRLSRQDMVKLQAQAKHKARELEKGSGRMGL